MPQTWNKQTDESVCGKRGRSRHVDGAVYFRLAIGSMHTLYPPNPSRFRRTAWVFG